MGEIPNLLPRPDWEATWAAQLKGLSERLKALEAGMDNPLQSQAALEAIQTADANELHQRISGVYERLGRIESKIDCLSVAKDLKAFNRRAARRRKGKR